jgi:hypothetical protein
MAELYAARISASVYASSLQSEMTSNKGFPHCCRGELAEAVKKLTPLMTCLRLTPLVICPTLVSLLLRMMAIEEFQPWSLRERVSVHVRLVQRAMNDLVVSDEEQRRHTQPKSMVGSHRKSIAL